MMSKNWFVFLLLLMCLGPTVRASNLLRNASFEIQGSWSEAAYAWEPGNPDGQGGVYGNARRTDWRHLNGSWEGAICGLWAGDPSDMNGWWQEAPATSNRLYTFSGWFWADDNQDIPNIWTSEYQCIKLEFYDQNTNFISSLEQNLGVIKEYWVKKTVSGTSPSGTAWVRAVIHVSYPQHNAALQFDDLSLTADEPGLTPRLDPAPVARSTPLVISEIMYHPADRSDTKDLEFFELFNTEPFSLDISGYTFSDEISYTVPPDTVIGPRSYLVVAAAPSDIADVYGITNVIGPYERKLSNGGGAIQVFDDLDTKLLQVEYATGQPWPAAPDGGGCSLVLAASSYGPSDPRGYMVSTFRGGSPGTGMPLVTHGYHGVLINEFLAHTDDPLLDYIELYNASDAPVDLAGCVLTDDPATNKFIIPPATTIPAHGFLVYDSNELGFNLSSTGEEIFFYSADGSNVIDAVAFPGQQNGVSCGRYPDGGDGFYPMATRTEGSANSLFRQESICINEIMYHPIS
ncbi:MAG: lamin tail domain-containing protein, partial [Spartobacteria bacterium]|nr:lamin tail domain-containing protein [Spartobacteria bacterium]